MDSSNRRTLYPEIEPYNTGTLQVSDVHTLYYEQCGNPNGKPAVVLHGLYCGLISIFFPFLVDLRSLFERWTWWWM